MYAAYHNHVGVANVLIKNNCDLNTTDYVKKNSKVSLLLLINLKEENCV